MLWMVRPKVTLTARLGLTGFFNTITMSRMAGAARTKATIWIDSAYTNIRPALKFTPRLGNNKTPVTLNTSKIHIIVMIVRIPEKP